MSYPPYGNQQQQGYGNQYGSPPPAGGPLSPPPGGAGGGGKTSMGLDENVAGALCYGLMPICCLGVIASLVFFFTEKTSRFVRFHAMQALLIFAAAIAVSIVLGIIGVVLGMVSDILVWLFLLVRILIGLVFLGVWIFCAIKAFQGTMFKLPVIGDLAENISGKQI